MGDFVENIDFQNDEWWLDDNEVDEILRELVANEQVEDYDSGYESQDEVEAGDEERDVAEEEEEEVAAEVQREEEEVQNNNADAAADIFMDQEEEEEEHEEPMIESDAETIEYIFDNSAEDPDYYEGSSSSSSSSGSGGDDNDDDDDDAENIEEEEEEYNIEVGVARENELHRIKDERRRFYSRVRDLCAETKAIEFDQINRELHQLRESRRRFNLCNRRRHRRRRHQPYMDVPKRYADLCYGCGKRFWCQRIRKWVRCVDCGLWLCPDCSYEPQHHCREDPF